MYGRIYKYRRIKKCLYFKIFKRKGEYILNNESITNLFTPLSQSQTEVEIKLYFSNSNNPIYINEKGVFQIGRFSLDIKEINQPIEKRIIEIKMEFSYCYS